MSSPGVSLEVLTWGIGEVIEPIPPSQRHLFPYFRGAHLGAIGLALAISYPSLAVLPDQDGVASGHVTSNYHLAYQHARNLATPADSLQFDETHKKLLSDLVGSPLPAVMPSIVFGLRPSATTNLKPAEQARMGCVAAPLTLDMIDPYSSATLQSLMNITL